MGLKDIFSAKGGLEKLKITAFTDDEYKHSTKTYVVMYNPTAYSYEVNPTWIPEKGVDPDAKQLQFRGYQSDKASFEFLFDATAASPPGADKPGEINLSYLNDAINRNQIQDEKISAIDIIKKDKHVDRAIKEFLDMAHIEGKTHTPSYLQINWGAYQFQGVLSKATINYKLFNNAGLPIRATVSAEFTESLTRPEQAAIKKTTSPDLTHKRVVRAGDTLPIIANRIYGDPGYYLEIAKVNNLKNFRRIKEGQSLILPPIEK